MNTQANEIVPALLDLAQAGWRGALPWDRLAPDLVRIGIILVGAFIGYRLIKLFTRRLLTRRIEEEDPLLKRMREQRAQTLAGLLSNVALVVIATVAGLTVLGTFIDIGPLLATAGVAGLAVSFGAQSLVKDIISGAFILVEGQFGIGDVVRVGDAAGMVEKITLRTTILRDLHGVVHIIPNGEITRLSNLTKAWSRAVIDVGVAYREDVDRVLDVLRELGGELQADPEWGVLLLEPPEVLGVEAFGDSSVNLRMMAKTLPLKQWDVARELRRRIKKRFDAEGIEIPYPHVTFYWGEGQMPTPPGVENPLEPPERARLAP
ncbi:MAG: mechanosensitive ion channel family protein [Gemmatimonadetes bacterium]|nr:mechanosensitive ion channel family protein [Gemmatimonadota bacterium]